ncbi:hypothetical protein F8S09_02195 [Deinococcus sp. SDU3-2]|uniref:Uncharacterized protein n=1 Tax=Deinococcus terrestris TaxID=2651870 RepID=A0A7X1NUC8_9DEIO|nr:hypothetical protein [Deinococcus terrestris]MPY65504.1 hypothetical protein [Deinococcus terrestris]
MSDVLVVGSRQRAHLRGLERSRLGFRVVEAAPWVYAFKLVQKGDGLLEPSRSGRRRLTPGLANLVRAIPGEVVLLLTRLENGQGEDDLPRLIHSASAPAHSTQPSEKATFTELTPGTPHYLA